MLLSSASMIPRQSVGDIVKDASDVCPPGYPGGTWRPWSGARRRWTCRSRAHPAGASWRRRRRRPQALQGGRCRPACCSPPATASTARACARRRRRSRRRQRPHASSTSSRRLPRCMPCLSGGRHGRPPGSSVLDDTGIVKCGSVCAADLLDFRVDVCHNSSPARRGTWPTAHVSFATMLLSVDPWSLQRVRSEPSGA